LDTCSATSRGFHATFRSNRFLSVGIASLIL
jgi:hypothetical protein